MVNILVVEDNQSIQKLMVTYLEKAGYKAFEAGDGLQALAVLENNHVDMMVVDVMMPNMDGYKLTESLREADYNFPILMVTAKDRIEDKKKGFRLGIDDYMVKPIDFDEMLLRVEALLRRAKISFEQKIEIGSIILHYDTLAIKTTNQTIYLPQKEFYLLYKLLSYPNKIFTRQDLMDEIWGFDTETDVRTVDVHIKRLREKLGFLSEFKIVTVRGLGYKVEKRV